MIDINKEKILEVYASQKHASKARNFKTGAAICKAVKQFSISSGHYWKKYDDCSDELKTTYNKSLPEKSISNISIKINILNKSTNEIVKTYNSVSDIIKEFQISRLTRLTLNKICKNKTVYKNFLFEFVK
jgi:lysyl-tRNA synthetase class I